MQNSAAAISNKWTPEQWAAITTTGKSLLVSAAAGSGKTSVLAERCVHLLCDTPEPLEVADLLVVTFTEAAAAEMKARIAKSLTARHSKSPTEKTARHLAMLDRANISTLHGFCARVLRQNFHLMGLDPEFRILDEDEAALMRLDIANTLFEDRYDNPDDADFRRMIDCYADGQDDRLMKKVIQAYNTLCSVVDPVAWIEQARHRIEEAIDLPMDQSFLGKAYAKTIRSELQSLLRDCQDAGVTIKALQNFDAYVQELRKSYLLIKHWIEVFDTAGIDALAEEAAVVEFEKLKPVKSTVEGKELAKARLDEIRKSMKEGSWRKNLMFSAEEWKAGLRLTLPHVDVFLSLVADFSDRYSKAKDEDGSLDFADLERLTLRSLKVENELPITPSPLAKNYQHQFKQVLVDEYQDINQVQDAILSLLSRECLAGAGNLAPNLFCVGDVKQSIYRFRLAEAKQFLERREAYLLPDSHGQLIDLQMNFRSRAPLLDAINGLFERLMTREAAELDYDNSQKLKPGQVFPTLAMGFTGSPIELHLLPKEVKEASDTVSSNAESEGQTEEADLDRTQREAFLLGHRVLEMMGKKGKPAMQVVDRSGDQPVSRDIRFGDIVLLLRSMKFKADQFALTLRSMGVPVHTDSSTGYFEATEINDILSLLHVLDNQQQDIHLAALLRSPLVNLPEPESSLAKIRMAYSGEPKVPFHLAVQKYADEQTDSLAIFLRSFRAKLQHWRQEIRQRPVAEMLWTIYDQTGYLTYVCGLPNGTQRQANLIELHDRARQFGSFHRQGLGRFLTFLEKLKAERDLGQASIASGADDVVRIMSIHASKGQEFPVVLLPDLGKMINLSDTHGSILLDRTSGLGMAVVDDEKQIRYPSLASTVVQRQLKQQSLAEELRVLYVAMTRAKEHLILVGTCGQNQPEKWKQQWANHTGPLPAEAVLAARTPLDWVGPVASILPNQFQTTMHGSEEINTWSLASAKSAWSPLQEHLAELKPLDPPPVRSAEAQQVIDRLNQTYPYQHLTDTPAAKSVSSLVKSTEPLASAASTPLAQSANRVLRHPNFVVGKLPVNAADIGTATHAVLENFDFAKVDFNSTSASAVSEQIRAQIQQLVDSRRLSKALSEVVDVAALEWFVGSEIGQLLQQHAAKLHREVPVYYTPPMDQPANGRPSISDRSLLMDQPMLRGRIDLMLPVDSGWMIVDYKTDRVSGASLDQRAALYAGQLEEYRKAIHQITGKPVVRCALVFLHPREIRSIS